MTMTFELFLVGVREFWWLGGGGGFVELLILMANSFNKKTCILKARFHLL